MVATLRALKYNGGVPKAETAQPNVEAVKAGLCNLAAHVENMKKFGVPVVVAINHFLTDSDEEIAVLENYCRENDVEFALSDVFAKGGEGGVALAEKVVKACEKTANFAPLYDIELPIKEKIDIIAKNIYGADSRCLLLRGAQVDCQYRKARTGQTANLHGKDPVLAVRRPFQA